MLRLPRTSNGFIDLDKIIYFVVVELGLQLDDIDRLNMDTIVSLMAQKNEKQKDEYDMLAHVVMVGVNVALNGGEIDLFGRNGSNDETVNLADMTEDEAEAFARKQEEELNKLFD